MKKGIFTALFLVAMLFCTAQSRRAATCGASTVADADGNIYNTVLIGDQCWMAENLRVGTMIDGSVNQTANGIIEKHCYDNNLSNCTTYGGLYQWNELMQSGAQAVCPAGWHVPSDSEWQWLATILAGSAGGKMKTTGTIEGGTGLWHAPNTGATNSSGFTALPGGRKDDAGNFVGLGSNAFFFSTTPWWYCCAYFRQLNYDGEELYQSWTYLSQSLSVRCLKNTTTALLPTVSTSPVTGITATTAVGGGNVTDDGGAPVTARGVVWSTTAGPAVGNNQGITTNGTGTGVFTSNLTGLAPETAFFVRAYATNSEGTAYGAEVEFTTAVPVTLALSGLTIGAAVDTCFDASLSITVSGFNVAPGGSATMIAGGNIRLQPVTHVASGGYLHASITTTQNFCVQPAGMLQSGSEKTAAGPQTMELQDASAMFTIFPNPAAGNFTLAMADFDATRAIRVEICSMMGVKVLRTELPGRRQYEFDCKSWPVGVYLIRVVAGDKMSVGKLVKR
ncbi:MAG: T9SS type A sorting domain-containing protein [Bacteroidetes bacterium]|nr:T9SS type A sorting domain-containing protein [Bacteroidota bacterium]